MGSVYQMDCTVGKRTSLSLPSTQYEIRTKQDRNTSPFSRQVDRYYSFIYASAPTIAAESHRVNAASSSSADSVQRRRRPFADNVGTLGSWTSHSCGSS